ncbi:MAG: hypothetical protein GAK45_02010 [Pseudomonas citronellolis]|nr:MAG: hypothetical protein GAK45_02010 [Pseudomonas citronellolis]
MLGVFSSSVAGSSGRHSGLQWGLGYQYAASPFSVDLSTLRAVRGYGDLGSRAASPVTRSQDQITLSWPLGERQSMALSYIGVRYPASEPARIASIACNTSIAQHMMAGVSAYQDLARDAQRLSVNFRFREGSATLDNKAQRDVERLLAYLKTQNKMNAKAVLVGFGDPKQDPARAQLLSKLRAMAVRRELAKEGVIFRDIVGLGAAQPVAANDDFEGRVKNRRVEVWVY